MKIQNVENLLSVEFVFHFHSFADDDRHFVILEVPRATTKPVQFQGVEYIRHGSYTKKLKDFPEKERELWRLFDKQPFESLVAMTNISAEEVVRLIDYPTYFDLIKFPLPETRRGILERLIADDVIIKNEAGNWDITNMGATLFAKRLDDFKSLRRKAVRVIMYRDNSRLETIKELITSKGYAVIYDVVVDNIMALTPGNEVIERSIRREIPMYPEIAIRELLANMLIHQDFTITGAGPIVEIFVNRIEFTNPGKPLVETDRFVDMPPRSRNESIAAFMRRMGFCEERGSGIDKVVRAIEEHKSPAPAFDAIGDNTRTILFAPKPFIEMSKTERIHAAYLHACVRFVNLEYLTNKSLRERFGLEEKNIASITRVINDAVKDCLIVPIDQDGKSRRHAQYKPNWA